MEPVFDMRIEFREFTFQPQSKLIFLVRINNTLFYLSLFFRKDNCTRVNKYLDLCINKYF